MRKRTAKNRSGPHKQNSISKNHFHPHHQSNHGYEDLRKKMNECQKMYPNLSHYSFLKSNSVIGGVLVILLLAVIFNTPTTNVSNPTHSKTDAMEEHLDRTQSNLGIHEKWVLPEKHNKSQMQHCSLYVAESTFTNSGLGIFAGTDYPKNTPIGPSDIVIQLMDVVESLLYLPLHLLIDQYAWDGQETGGQYEGKKVFSLLPGIGMLANGHPSKQNVAFGKPNVDEAGLTRFTSPNAGSISQYHNISYTSIQSISAGSEIIIGYGKKWFNERVRKGKIKLDNDNDHLDVTPKRSLDWLQDNGLCLDNIREDTSNIPNAGRGAFVTRDIKKGDIITSSPLIYIHHEASMKTFKKKEIEDEEIMVHGKQLLLNYCYSHINSTSLFFPYSPVVNFINHDSKSPNTVIKWSTLVHGNRGKDWPYSLSHDDLNKKNYTGLIIDYIATRDIQTNEEILMDYGTEWENAHSRHVNAWTPILDSESYIPAYAMDDIVQHIRTVDEQKSNPYPENILTSCFYRFSAKLFVDHTKPYRWKLEPGIYNFINLRPCLVLARDLSAHGDKGEMMYTVLIMNRFGLENDKRVPSNVKHIVTHVPRKAIRFSDKLYTTDQHLPNAFRHPIAFPDDMFPRKWMDLS